MSKKVDYGADHRNQYGHRTFPNGDTMYDESCEGCTSRRMTDDWRNFLGITDGHIRITVRVDKLDYVIRQISRETPL